MAEQPLDTGFEDKMKATLTSLRPYLVDNLGVQLDDLLDHLENDVFPHVENIKVKPTSRGKVRKLLDDLVKRPARCFWTFISCLFEQRIGQGHIAVKILQEYKRRGGQVRPHIRKLQTRYKQQQLQHRMQVQRQVQQQQQGSGITESGSVLATDDGDSSETAAVLPMEMDTDAPDLGGGDARPVFQTPVQAVGREQNQSSLSEYQKKRNADNKNVYKMDSKPRGVALIINNENFDYLERRVGTDQDCQELAYLFGDMLHFDVLIHQDLTGEGMERELSNFLTYLSEQQRDVDSCMIAILSHGWKGNVIFGTDGCLDHQYRPETGTFITTDDLRQFFSSFTCSAMEGKPKLFIIQACRGELEDTTKGQKSYHRDGPDTMPSSETVQRRQHPDKADVYIMYAAVEDYVAYRNLFIQILVNVFKRYADTEHLAELHSRVNEKMTKRRIEDHIFTLSEGSSTLGKLWYFNP